MPFVQALKYRKVFEEAIQPYRVEARLWLYEKVVEAQIKLLGFAEGTDKALNNAPLKLPGAQALVHIKRIDFQVEKCVNLFFYKVSLQTNDEIPQ